MNNSAGVFQIQETLGKKIVRSPLKGLIEILAIAKPPGSKKDDRIIQRLILTEKGFEAY